MIVWATPAGAQALPVPAANASQNKGENGEMAKSAIDLTLIYNSDLNADLAGGQRTGGAYLQRVGLIADVSLADAVGWQGAKLHASVHAINGTGLSGHFVGNLLTVSGLEAEPALRLFNLWVEEDLGHGASLRVGQFTAAQEFIISGTATLFVNSTFGWPGSFATDLPSGGPAYPLAAPGIRFAGKAGRSTNIRLALFAGDPAGPGSGDPQRRDVHGFNGLRLHGRPFAIGEIERDFGGAVPFSLVVGGWAHFGRFQDVRSLGFQDPSSAAPADAAQRYRGNFALYALGDIRLLQNGRRSLHGFIRGSASPSDRNPIDLYFDTGLSLQGPLRSRPHDKVGVALATARISPRLRSGDQMLHGAGARIVPSLEAALELSYQFELSSHAYLEPNVQWIIHPAGDVVVPQARSAGANDHVLVAGLRTSATF
jgi:porin